MDALGACDAAGTHNGEGANESGRDEAEGKEGEEGVGTGVEGEDDAPLGVEIVGVDDALHEIATGERATTSVKCADVSVFTGLSESIIIICAFHEEAEI